MFSDELLLVQSVVEQIDAVPIGVELTVQEYLLHVRAIVSPFIGAVKSKWGLQQEAQVLEMPKGKVLMAIIFSAVQAKFPRFDDFMDEAVERFVAVKECDDVIKTLDAIQLLPFMMRIIHEHIDGAVKEIVEQVAATSSGVNGIFPAIQHSITNTILPHFASLSINQHIVEYIETKTRLSYIHNRFTSLFELMAMLPDSEPAFHELAIVLRSTPCDLCDLLKWSEESCRLKLLSPAIPTDTIIEQFVHGAKMFKLLDPTGLLLDRCGAMARQYLMERRPVSEVHDCVFKMLSMLLEAMPPSATHNEQLISFDVKHEEYLSYYYQPELIDDDWLPDPPAAGKTPIRHSSKSFNHLAVLANFSDKQNLFKCLHESVMKQLLSGHLAHGKILKRITLFASALFGRALCAKLLVMLHDAQVSKEVLGVKNQCLPLIISKSYWPVEENVEGVECEELDKGFPNMEMFNQEFAIAKPKRHLKWIPELSTVDMDLKIDEITYTLNGVPFHAYSVMQKLLQSTIISPRDLSECDKEGTMYWVERGFCRLQPDNTLSLCKPNVATICDVPSLRAHLFDTLQTTTTTPMPSKIPPHIITMATAMLTNLGPMPAARIHAMLVTMAGLKQVEVSELTDWLMARPEVQYDPVTGVFCRATK